MCRQPVALRRNLLMRISTIALTVETINVHKPLQAAGGQAKPLAISLLGQLGRESWPERTRSPYQCLSGFMHQRAGEKMFDALFPG